MNLINLPTGLNPPSDIYVVVEISQGSISVKYEIDKASGALFVSRFLHTAMYYPINYGFIPNTIAEDEDPLDAIIIENTPIVPGTVVRSKPIGVLYMEDEKGKDEKIVTIPVDTLNPYFENVTSCKQLPTKLCDQIFHFFSHYKDLERDKKVMVTRWGDGKEAISIIKKHMIF